MRAVNKVSLYYNDWKVLKESSGLAELSSKGQLSNSNLPAVPICLSVLPEIISSSLSCPRC